MFCISCIAYFYDALNKLGVFLFHYCSSKLLYLSESDCQIVKSYCVYFIFLLLLFYFILLFWLISLHVLVCLDVLSV